MLHVHDYKNVRPILLSASVLFCLVAQTYTLLLSNDNMHLAPHSNFLRPRYQLPLLACISPLPFLRTETVDLFNSSAKLNDVKKSAPTDRSRLHPQIKNTTIQIVARGFAGTICVLTRI